MFPRPWPDERRTGQRRGVSGEEGCLRRHRADNSKITPPVLGIIRTMNERRKIMWLPMAVSGAALAAGLVGIVLTGDWRLLLVVAAATGLSEAIGLINFGEALKDTREEFEKHKEKMVAKLGVNIDTDKMFGWFDAIAAALVTFTTVAMAMILMARFSTSLLETRWVKVCLFLGCACVPWCYCYESANERFRKWTIFAVAAFSAVWLMVLPGESLLRAEDFALILLPVHLIHRWILNRKGVAA